MPSFLMKRILKKYNRRAASAVVRVVVGGLALARGIEAPNRQVIIVKGLKQ